MTRYLALQIGCIECGEESKVLGVFMCKEGADMTCSVAQVEHDKDWHGERQFQVFEIEVPE